MPCICATHGSHAHGGIGKTPTFNQQDEWSEEGADGSSPGIAKVRHLAGAQKLDERLHCGWEPRLVGDCRRGSSPERSSRLRKPWQTSHLRIERTGVRRSGGIGVQHARIPTNANMRTYGS